MGKRNLRITIGGIIAASLFVVALTPVWGATELALPSGCPYRDLRMVMDDYEVPTIHAESTEAAMFGAGFAQANHRLVQMEITRRLGRGELAAFVGEAMLPSDREMRRLSLNKVAEESLALYIEDERALVDAYTAGVNFYIENCAELPAEFVINGAPRAWTPPSC